MTKIKPMLAAAIKDVETLPYPMIASPKLDGIRCLKLNDEIVSRTLKLIPNHHIRGVLEDILPEGADGEILVGDTFQACTSGVMSHEGSPEFTFWMFDLISKLPYQDRLFAMDQWREDRGAIDRWVRLVPTTWIRNTEDLLAFEAECLDAGFEGVCLRTPDSPYKYGRSTLKQGYLLKLKRFEDGEAEILAIEEQYENTNELRKDELGYAKRSHTKEGRKGKDTLGRFLVRDLQSGVEFAIGTGEGLTDRLRKIIWVDREGYIGRIIKYKSQPHGAKDAPRLPIFLGFRDLRDM